MTSRAATPYPLAFWPFALGIFTCTWDTLLTLELHGFTLKLYQLLFLLSLVLIVVDRRREGFSLLKPLATPFAFSMLVMAMYHLGLAPWSAFPLKSFLYSCWLVFDVIAIWLTAQHLAKSLPIERILSVVWGTLLFLSTIVLIDHIAYQYGYIGGLIGNNQDSFLRWGVSRPHAFTFEPSYLAAFLSLGLITAGNHVYYVSKRKWAFWAGLFLVVFAVFATTSRTGLVSIFGGLAGVLLLPSLNGRRVQWSTIGIVVVTAFLSLGSFYLLTPEKQRVEGAKFLLGSILQGEDGSGNARMRAFGLAYRFAADTNWLGTGIGASYRFHLSNGGVDLLTPDPLSVLNTGNEVIMSTWGQMLAEGGAIATLLYAAAAFFLMLGLFRAWKVNDGAYELGAFSAALVFFSFTALFLGNVCRGDIWIWYALWAMPATRIEFGIPKT